jgi:heat shock protein HslJ
MIVRSLQSRWLSGALAAAVLTIGGGCAPAGTDVAPAGETEVVVAPTLEELAAATFTGIFDRPITLHQGRWEGEPFDPNGVSRPSVGLVDDFLLTGDLDADGREEAVVLLWSSSGGSGTRLYLTVMGTRDEGIENLGTKLIGDRVQVRSASHKEQVITLDLVQAGPGDAMCCPTQKAAKSWRLTEDGLAMVASEVTGTLSLVDLEGPVWTLTELGWDQAVPEGVEITLAFEDGKVSGSGGCNRYFGGVISEAPGELTFSAMGATRMACAEPAMGLEQRYLATLSTASQYSFIACRLALSCVTEDGVVTLLFESR